MGRQTREGLIMMRGDKHFISALVGKHSRLQPPSRRIESKTENGRGNREDEGISGGGVRMEELKKYKQQSHCLNKTFSPELSEFYDETKCLLSSVGAVLPQVNAK